MNSPALCAKVVNSIVAGVRRDPSAAPAIPRDGIMELRAAGMRYNALKHISRAKNSAAGQAEGGRLLDEALRAERSAARGDEKLLARAQRRQDRLRLLRARGTLCPGDIACYRKAAHAGDAAAHEHPSPDRPPMGSGPAGSTVAEYDACPQPEALHQTPRGAVTEGVECMLAQEEESTRATLKIEVVSLKMEVSMTGRANLTIRIHTARSVMEYFIATSLSPPPPPPPPLSTS